MVVRPPPAEDLFRCRMEAMDRPLWMPLLLWIPSGTAQDHEWLVSLFRAHSRAGTSLLESSPKEWREAAHPSRESMLTAISEREKPSATVLSAWLEQRLGNGEIYAFVRSAMAKTTLVWSTRTMHRRLQEQLHCRPSDLKRLAHLARLRRLHPTVERLAAEARTTPTRLRERVKAGLGLSLREFNQMPGWEATLEAAVRAGLGQPGWGLGEGNHAPQRSIRRLTAMGRARARR